MDVQFSVVGQVVVDDEGDLGDVQTPGPHVGGDEDATSPGPELLHDGRPLLLRHVAVHGANGEVGLAHLFRQPVNLQSNTTM